MSEIEILVMIRDRLNLLLNSADPASDLKTICPGILKAIDDRLSEIQKQLNALV